jgi:hypothetical protein
MRKLSATILMITAATAAQLALAGPLDPDCTAEKAARSAATKATVGVGGRCDPKEAAADTAKRTTGIDDKGPVEKRRDDDKGVVKKATK